MTRSIGQDITPRRRAQAVTTIRWLIDLRQPLVPALSPKRIPAVRPTPPPGPPPPSSSTPLPPSPSTAEPAPADQSPPPEPAPASLAIPSTYSLRALGRWPWRLLLVRSLKLGLLLGAAFVWLSLPLELAQRLIGLYATAALLYAIDSQRTFAIALLFLIITAGSAALGHTDDAQTYARYTFYFLILGLISTIQEWFSASQRDI